MHSRRSLHFLLSFHGPEYMMFLGSNAANSSSNDKVPEEAGRRSEIRAVMLVAFVKIGYRVRFVKKAGTFFTTKALTTKPPVPLRLRPLLYSDTGHHNRTVSRGSTNP